MVDTINPNTSQPDTFPTTAQPETPIATSESDHFYGGFDRPEEVKINLAAGGAPADSFQPIEQAPAAAPSAAMPQTQVNDVQPAQPSFSPSESEFHDSYASSSPVNSRGLLVIGGVAVAVTLIAAVGAYFIIGATGSSKTKELQSQISTLDQQIASLKETPTALSAPSTPAEEEVVTAPVVTPPVETPPVETPVEIPASTPVVTNDDTRNAAAAG